MLIDRKCGADQRHHDLLDQRIDDLPERCSNNDAHRQINDVALEGKALELLEQ